MKYILVVLLAAVLAVNLRAGDKPEEGAKSTPQFDKLKSLEGTWQGKDEEGKPVSVSYKLVSGGSSLMETLEMEQHADAMVTMYHLNGTKLMMTHYCSMGNQPRMQVKKASMDENTLTFIYMDATNLADKNDTHMSKLVVTFKDSDHFEQDWTMSQDGKEAHHAVFAFERVKK